MKAALVVLVLVAGGTLWAQKATKKFDTDPRQYVLDPLLIKDEGCAADVSKALSLSGLAQRQLLVELAKYGCVESLKGLYLVRPTSVQMIGQAGSRQSFTKADLLADAEFGIHGAASVKTELAGWVVSRSILTRKDMLDIRQAAGAKQSTTPKN